MPVVFTNHFNLPSSFVDAILVDDHVTEGNISVTGLIDAPQIRQLKRTNTYEMDVTEMIGMVFGTGVHSILERGDIKGSKQAQILQQAAGVLRSIESENSVKNGKAADYLISVVENDLKEKIQTDIITERRLTIEVDGYTISGTFDRLVQSIKELQDYKTTSASAVMFPELKKSWDRQLNIYALMLRKNGYEVESAMIIAILKDWSKMKIKTSADYPKSPVVMHKVKIVDEERVMQYIKKRVALHKRADAGESIPCSQEERWAKADTWAVKKKGGKRALRVVDSQPAAQAFITQNQFKYKEGELVIEFRQSESFRCANGYCPVASVCPQYQKELEQTTEDASEM